MKSELEIIADEVITKITVVPPKLFGHQGTDYMKQYVKQVIITYEQIKKEKEPKYMKVLNIIKEVIMYG